MAKETTPRKFPKLADWQPTVRLASGLILMCFVTMHLLNHALGIISLEAMNFLLHIRTTIWRSPPGTILLYGSLIIHPCLTLYKVANRTTWRIPPTEVIRILFGLAIPFFLISHIVGTRGLQSAFDTAVNYESVLRVLYPFGILKQSLLLIFVWIHGIIGLHFWLRFKPWYPQFQPWFFTAAIVIPLLAQWGWIEAGRRYTLTNSEKIQVPIDIINFVNNNTNIAISVVIGGIALCLIYLAFNIIRHHYLRRLTIEYPGGQICRAMPGTTLLEISKSNAIPHASVCGGNARCSTCRTKIIEGGESLPAPSVREAEVLKRVGVDDDVRLACQIRPEKPLTVQPLLPVRKPAKSGSQGFDAYHWGVERSVAIMFVDIRSFTSISENKLSYDVVFMLNRYLEGVTTAIEQAGGYVDKFIGDGVMAIFGMNEGIQTGCRQSLEAASGILTALEKTNIDLADHLEKPLKIGIGIHAGQAILGRIGAAGGERRAPITALGDVVNTASRLESETKNHNATIIASRQVVQSSQIELKNTETAEIKVRGKSKPLTIFVIREQSTLADALDQNN